MKGYFFNNPSPITGGYFSSEQLDLLSIIQCNSIDELINFIKNCDQINHVDNLMENINFNDLDEAKRYVFKVYQDTMVFHNQSKNDSIVNRLKYLKINSGNELMDVINKVNSNSDDILSLNHHFVSDERDQNKEDDLYEEMVFLNSQLPNFNSLLLGSGKVYNVVNKYQFDQSKRYDFYHMQRDLDFAYRNGKQVRYHSLLVRDDATSLFDGKSKNEILKIISEYVKQSIDFINEYNKNHKVVIDGVEKPVINAVDLFNEIVSFEKNEKGEYYNIWEGKYGITIPELITAFDYALKNKPEGVSYLYNEPFLENDERRKKVLDILKSIDEASPGLIDTLGSQMHITISLPNAKNDNIYINEEKIKRCFEDFKKLQEETGKKIQITEFDMSLGSLEIGRVFGKNADISLEQVYKYKKEKIRNISKIINSSGVVLSGISYWSLTDIIDCNLERIRTNLLNDGQITDISQIPTVCGGLYPTSQKLIRNLNDIDESFNR